jgi:hypothetical protein
MDRPQSATLPRKFRFWEGDHELTPAEVVAAYESGMAGAWKDAEASAEFESLIVGSGGDLDGANVAAENGMTGAGEGRLVIPFTFVEKLYPGVWPGAAQQRGDCVSHDTKNAALTTMCCDVVAGKPDEVTGIVEGAPEIPAAGISQGGLSSEAIYWYRGYNGDGWSCEAAASVAIQKSALWLRQSYPELGIDLTKYSGSLAGKYGSRSPPAEITEFGRKHLVRTATRLRTKEERRDFLANGYGISTCGGESWSSSRDENGYSKRTSAGWAHAFAQIGFDDRPETKEKYGDSLELMLNSWGIWNSGGRKILGTDILIPNGAWWARSRDVQNRTFIALSGTNGWPSKKLPPVQLVVG